MDTWREKVVHGGSKGRKKFFRSEDRARIGERKKRKKRERGRGRRKLQSRRKGNRPTDAKKQVERASPRVLSPVERESDGNKGKDCKQKKKKKKILPEGKLEVPSKEDERSRSGGELER